MPTKPRREKSPEARQHPVRIVPLHRPESGAAAKAVAPHLTYRNGPLLTGVQVFTVFWGSWWQQAPNGNLLTQVNQFFDHILSSQLIDQLGEYSVPGQTIGHGSRIGSTVLASTNPSASVQDSSIQQLFQQEIDAGTLPATNANTRRTPSLGYEIVRGVAFSPEANKLFVASEKGKVYIYDGDSFKLINTLDFEGGADNLRYDAANKRVYVGCGDDEKNSAIAAVDAMANKRLVEVYKLGGEPESFQLEKSGPNIYVNIPDKKEIVVINRSTKELTRWPVTAAQNFPMALEWGRGNRHGFRV